MSVSGGEGAVSMSVQGFSLQCLQKRPLGSAVRWACVRAAAAGVAAQNGCLGC